MVIIVTERDDVPTKKIVEVLGKISAVTPAPMGERPEKCYQILRSKAEKMGADAVINVIYSRAGNWRPTCSASGLAVKLADLDRNLCPRCSRELPKGDILFCPFCGTRLNESVAPKV